MSLPEHDQPFAAIRPSTAGALLLTVLLIGTTIRFAVVHPVRNYLEDFRAYYAAGWALTHDVNPYDIDTIHERLLLPGKQPVYYYPYPPPSLIVPAPFSLVPYPLAQLPWCLFAMALAVISFSLLCRAAELPLSSPAGVLLGFAFFSSSSVFELFRWGQFDMVVLVLLALAVLAATRARVAFAGVAVALAALAKVTPCVYLGVFVLRRQWRALWAGLVAIVALMLGSWAVVGTDGFAKWLHWLTCKLGGIEHTISPENMSLHGYVYRAFVDHPSLHGPSIPWVNLGSAAAAIATYGAIAVFGLITAAWILHQRRELNSAEAIAACVPVVLLIAPITWTHHTVTLLIPLALIVGRLARVRRAWLDTLWVGLILLLWTVWPVQRFNLELPDTVRHLFAPTVTYAIGLTWLFMMCRYAGLRRRGTVVDA
ncbi:MAG: glycosyltransferase family 87 protein [Phycisphaerae bacterium]|jgi:alpha-1,2-mannosyltransferase